MSNEAIAAKLIDFIQSIGIPVRYENIAGQTFLPGMTIKQGTLVVDMEKLLYPGDLLHEAGHIAMTPAADRQILDETNTGQFDDGNEMAAMAWSYAACKHLNIDPLVVFHDHGYRGANRSLAANFEQGQYLGAPLLDWHGMANYGDHNPEYAVSSYPNMKHWLSQK